MEADLDGDGIINEYDDDMDGDGVPNRDDADRDGDGLPDDDSPSNIPGQGTGDDDDDDDDDDDLDGTFTVAPFTCLATPTTLCFDDDRFQVRATWTTPNGDSGVATSVQQLESDRSDLLWFFNSANYEMVVKVLNGCASNGHYWVFASATTNVGWELRVTDSETGRGKFSRNPVGRSSRTVTDTIALPVCP